MRGLEAGGDLATSGRRRDCCSGRRESRSTVGSLAAVLFALCVGIYGDVAHGYIDAYQQLENYGFPVGLLPHTVTGYELAENGKFAVYLESKCEIDIPAAFPVVYSKKIAGKLSYGSLRDLSGIQVKIYYFWLSITAITVQNENLKFEVFSEAMLLTYLPADNGALYLPPGASLRLLLCLGAGVFMISFCTIVMRVRRKRSHVRNTTDK